MLQMDLLRPIRFLCLIFCMIVFGCQPPVNPDVAVAEYPPHSQPMTYHPHALSTLSLWRWEISSDPAYRGLQSDGKAIELPTEVQRLSLEPGSAVGFKMDGGQLFAVAGETRIPLAPGHYTWQLLSEEVHAHSKDDSGDGATGPPPSRPINGIDPETGLRQGSNRPSAQFGN
jgi:hypothetical protein